MTRIQKFISLIPFFIMCGCLAESWVYFLSGYSPSPKHYVTLGLVILNGALYFIRFRTAIWITGAILLFGIANVVSFYYGTDTFSIMSSPPIETRSFLILIVYGIIDFGVYGHEFFRRRTEESDKEVIK